MTFVFSSATPPDGDLPLSIFPDGVHCRADGDNYLTGGPPEDDGPVDYDDFAARYGAALANVLANLLLGLGAVALGFALIRR